MNKFSRKLRGLLFFTFVAINSIALAKDKQNGGQFLTNIKYQNNANNYVWSIAQTARKTLIIASRTGVLEYNSEEWIDIKTPDISLCLLSSKFNDDKIYTCGRNHIGYLKQNVFGEYVYSPISKDIGHKDIFTDILETDSATYFYSSQKLLRLNPNDNSLSPIKNTDSTSTFLGAFTYDNKLYLSVQNKGLFFADSNTLHATKGLEKLNNQHIVFSCDFDSTSTLVGTKNGKLFLLSSRGIVPFKVEDEDYLQKGIISDGLIFSGSRIAISFKNLGLLIIDKFTGKTIDIIDRESGLPDEFVMALFADNAQSLWMANTQGLSSIDLSLPIKNYNSYFGIEGSIITSNFWNKKLYVATSEGVFLLDSISNYDMREAYKKIPIVNHFPSTNTPNIILDEKTNPVNENNEYRDSKNEEIKKNRKGFFKRLFVSKEESDNTDTKASKQKAPLTKPTKTTQKPKFEYFQYQQLILKSKQFGFSRLGELKERCSNLISVKNQLLAVTNTDIYSIDADKNLSAIFSGSNILEVVPSKFDNTKIYVVDKGGIYAGLWENGNWSFTLKTESNNNFNITSLAEISEQSFLVALNNQLVKVDIETGEITDIPLTNPYSESVFIKQVDERIFVLVGAKLYSIDSEDKNLTKLNLYDDFSVALAFMKQPNQFCIKTSENKYQYFGTSSIPPKALSALKIFNNISNVHLDSANNIWLINNSDEIYRLNATEFGNYNLPCKVYLSKIQTSNGTALSGDEFILKHSENSLIFSFVSPSTLKLNSTQYQYIIEGLMEDWSDWNNNNEFTIPYFPAGNYKLKFRAKNILEELSEIESVSFKVLPPFWKTFYFYAFLIITVGLGFYYWQRYRLKRLVKEKKNLQNKVKERTEELQKQNEAITDSINYAGRIQKALLPPRVKLDSLISDYFVYYKPKDIISGDFYLAVKRKNYTVVIAADCTGHGVPGAFMSMLGMAYIYDVLSAADSNITAAEILNTLRNKIITLLHQHGTASRDGMDMVVLLFDKEKHNLQYAGAHNPLYRLIPKSYTLSEVDSRLVSNVNDRFYMLQYKGNRFQVGNSIKAHVDFTNHVIDYRDDERFYIFSDGYVDQFGGEEERKFMYGRFRELIINMAHEPMKDQKNILKKTIKLWMNDTPQTDDILVFGLTP